MIHLITAGMIVVTLVSGAMNEAPAPVAASTATATVFDTSYRPSATLTARTQRQFLQDLRWSAGAETRRAIETAFAERAPLTIWQDLVAGQRLAPNNVADALAAYWVLNWITANRAYGTAVDHAPVQRQLASAFANDPNFLSFGDAKRQELAEGYMLNFLVEHAALNHAIQTRNTATLNRLAAAAVTRFQQNMKVNLLALSPGPDGFAARPAN